MHYHRNRITYKIIIYILHTTNVTPASHRTLDWRPSTQLAPVWGGAPSRDCRAGPSSHLHRRPGRPRCRRWTGSTVTMVRTLHATRYALRPWFNRGQTVFAGATYAAFFHQTCYDIFYHIAVWPVRYIRRRHLFFPPKQWFLNQRQKTGLP